MLRSQLIGCIAPLAAVGAAQAALIPLTLQDTPDIFASFLDVDYDAGSDSLSITGFPLTYDDDGIGMAETFGSGSFDLRATVDDTGNATGGLLEISGSIPGLGINDPLTVLLTGTLTNFGFDESGGDPLEFIFSVTGGQLAADYGGIGAEAGVIASGTNFPGNFMDNFHNDQGTGRADVAPPVPAPMTAAFIGGLAFATRRRR